MKEELPTQRVAGVEYVSCEWCGQAVSQLGTRTPRRYCQRSHRQRAYEARKYGFLTPYEKERADAAAKEPSAPLPAPTLFDVEQARPVAGPPAQRPADDFLIAPPLTGPAAADDA